LEDRKGESGFFVNLLSEGILNFGRGRVEVVREYGAPVFCQHASAGASSHDLDGADFGDDHDVVGIEDVSLALVES
jgi:hypothetical protein